MLFFFFFFSSRRRHTRLQGDWSSDVCSSDLDGAAGVDDVGGRSGVRSNAARTAVLVVSVLVAATVGGRQGWWGPPRRNLALSAPLDRSHTASIPAYPDYLDGLSSLNQRTHPRLRAAIFYFERAIEQDSSYALAYAALADCYVLLGLYNTSSQEVLPKARAAAAKAAELDSASAEAHTALADRKSVV